MCIAVLALSGCKDKTKSANYKQPFYALKGALNYGDTQSYLAAFLPQEKARYTSDENYDPDFLSQAFNRDDYISRLGLKVMDTRELSEKNLDKLEAEAHKRYGTHFSFSKGYKVSVVFSAQDKKGIYSQNRKLNVVRYENVWYIFGDVIDSFDLN